MNTFFRNTFLILIQSTLFHSELLLSNVDNQNTKEKQLIAHVTQSIDNAYKGISRLTDNVLKIEGMSSPKVRHLLNNLCSYPNTNYLEIGTWKGSTWISALFGNEASVLNATAIDDWSQFGGPAAEFHGNCKKFLANLSYNISSADCFKLNLESLITQPVTIYFYDGGHTEIEQEMAFTYYDKAFDDVFIAIVDDWNLNKAVEQGTRTAFEKLGYQILFEIVLPNRRYSDIENWWNGLYVAVIRKP